MGTESLLFLLHYRTCLFIASSRSKGMCRDKYHITIQGCNHTKQIGVGSLVKWLTRILVCYRNKFLLKMFPAS